MTYILLLLVAIAFLCLEWLLDNILWIGGIVIVMLLISIFRAVPYYEEFGFDSGEFMILFLKLGGIAGIIALICMVQ